MLFNLDQPVILFCLKIALSMSIIVLFLQFKINSYIALVLCFFIYFQV